jgi:predicted RNA-binding protein YlqC (UPF0109 family)
MLTNDQDTMNEPTDNTADTSTHNQEMDPLTDSDLLTEILRAFVTRPEEIRVEESRQDNCTNLTIHVSQDDVGVVIGRDHSTIQALRHIFSRVAVANNSRTYVHIAGEVAQHNFQPPRPQMRPQYDDQRNPNQNFMGRNRRPDNRYDNRGPQSHQPESFPAERRYRARRTGPGRSF